MSTWIMPLSLPGMRVNVSRSATYRTSVKSGASGKEWRAQWWTVPQWKYTLAFEFARTAVAYRELQQLVGILMTHAGSLDSFLLSDPEDNEVTNAVFGIGTGTQATFQLQRSWLAGTSRTDMLGTWPFYEHQRTNLILQSSDLSQAVWAKLNATVAVDQPPPCISPDGTRSADLLLDNATSGNHQVAQTITFGATPYIFSVYVRPGNLQKLKLMTMVSAISASFDLVTKTVTGTTGCTATITDIDMDGWCRCSINFTPSAGAQAIGVRLLNVAGVDSYAGSTWGLYLWGAQLEASIGGVASRPIPTAAAMVRQDPPLWPAVGDGYEPIFEPRWPGLVALVNSILYAWSPGSNGQVVFGAAPAAGSLLTWSGRFYRRVRFEGDAHDATRMVQNIWSVGSINLLTVKP